jgi:LacI family transcriptional regulator
MALKSHNVDGILMIPSTDDPQMIVNVAAEIPLILLDRYYEQNPLPYVSSENEKGAYEGTRFLLNKGHRKIAFIQGKPHVITSSERVKGFQRAMQEVPEAESFLVGDDFSVENGYQSAKELASREESQKPTAIFAGNNTILFGILKAFRELKALNPIPMDLLCFDNPNYMQFFPFVYRIGQNLELMGEEALNMLIRKIEAKQKQQEENVPSLLLPVDLSLLKD